MTIIKVLMFGDREYSKRSAVRKAVQALAQRQRATRGLQIVVIAGGAPGADTLAEEEAHAANLHVARVDALWPIRGVSAGPQRNGIMVALEPDEGICFHADLKSSKGSADMARRLDRAGIPWRQVK